MSAEQKIAIIGNIQEKKEQQKKLLEELKRSLLIQELWPEAFDNGKLTSHISRYYGGLEEAKKIKIIFKNDAEEKEFLLTDLPPVLRVPYLKPFLEDKYCDYRVQAYFQKLIKEDVK